MTPLLHHSLSRNIHYFVVTKLFIEPERNESEIFPRKRYSKAEIPYFFSSFESLKRGEWVGEEGRRNFYDKFLNQINGFLNY